MHSVKRNIVWNLLGNVLPLITGLILFPLIVAAYGLERFGLLTLAWALVGYFGLFDLGLARALTQLVSEQLAKQAPAIDVSELIHTTLRLMWLLGLLGGIVLWLASPYIVIHLLKVSQALQQETIYAFSVLALLIPIAVHTSALRGILEALHLFKTASLIRMVMGVGTFLGPYLASLYSGSLVGAIYALIVVRVVVWLMHIVAVKHSRILLVEGKRFNRRWLAPLLSFGGWMTVTNIIGPLMVYMDRFVIVSMLGAASVAYYVAPYEVVTKMLVVPVAISGVLFPLFAREWQTQPQQSALKLNQGLLYTLILLFPASLVLVYFAQEWLSIWLGAEFSAQGRIVVVWLVAGVLVNSAAQIVFAKVQGAGRSDWTAKLHLLELLPYLGLLWFALRQWGIAGAAFAWFLRTVIDMLGLLFFANKISPHNWHEVRLSVTLLLMATIILTASIFILPLTLRLMVTAAALAIYGILTIQQLRHDQVLAWLRTYLKRA